MCANDNIYQYYIYAGLSALFIISEALGLTKNVAPNSITQVAELFGKYLTDKYKKADTKAELPEAADV
jgi:hypothetical protein